MLSLGRPTSIANLSFKQQCIDSHMQSVTRACRDSSSISHAKELVPIGEIVQDNLQILEDEFTYKDNLLPLLVRWFSTQFFKWFETPVCDICADELRFAKSYVNLEKKQVELYRCDKDDYESMFVRHNEPAILLYTRTGRCGEWAMCFLTILKAMDYHARVVHDSTDHCWNEVWSEPKQQFIHVDPCENITDSPLLYEAGWRKKLEYCLAMGQYEVQDVTKRYCIDFNATLARRTQCEEAWLSQCLNQTTLDLVALAPSEDLKATILERRAKDMKYLDELAASPRKIPDKSELTGRKTGSIQWRISRGEYQVAAKKGTVITARHSGSLLQNDIPVFELHYNCDKNAYQSTASEYNLSNWLSLVNEYENLDHKYERDWKTSYVSRYEDCPCIKDGWMRWRLDLSELSTLDWQTIEILVSGKQYPETLVMIELKSYISAEDTKPNETVKLSLNEIFKTSRTDLGSGVKFIDLEAVLTGGDGRDEVAWQKPQLFRQTRGKNSDKSAFYIKIY